MITQWRRHGAGEEHITGAQRAGSQPAQLVGGHTAQNFGADEATGHGQVGVQSGPHGTDRQHLSRAHGEHLTDRHDLAIEMDPR